MEPKVIVAGAPTPIGCFGGARKDTPVGRLGAVVLNQALEKAGLKVEQVDEVIMGQAYQNGECANAACGPTLTYPAVDTAVRNALAKAGLGIGDIDLFEIQEAFAVQMLADAKLMGLTPQECERKVNVNGSGIRLGLAIWATGATRLVTLLNQMRRQGARQGLLSICGGGGQGVAGTFARD